jgi:hypothetical protein
MEEEQRGNTTPETNPWSGGALSPPFSRSKGRKPEVPLRAAANCTTTCVNKRVGEVPCHRIFFA